jgi:hypothetical protein
MSEGSGNQELEHWEQVVALQAGAAPDGDGPELIYRGQADASWQLTPSLLRLVRSLRDTNAADSVQVAAVAQAEEHALRFFQRQHKVTAHLEAWIVWWAVAQQYGGATRVLDWSDSVTVAVYFAVRDLLDRNGALYLLRQRLLRPGNDSFLKKVHNSDLTEEGWLVQQAIFKAGSRSAIHACTTNALGRMLDQKAWFTSCTNVLQDHDPIIRQHCSDPGVLRKLTIPRAAKPKLLREILRHRPAGLALFSDSSDKAGYAQRDAVIEGMTEPPKA